MACSQKIVFEKSSAPGSFVACSRKNHFLRNSSAPGSEAARDKWLVQDKKSFLEKKVLSPAAKLPGTSGLFKKKYQLQEKNLPQAAKLPGTSGLSENKSDF